MSGKNIAEASLVALKAAKGELIHVRPLGVGCWAWGDDKGVWGWKDYDKRYNEETIKEVFFEHLKAGKRLFDTAETYGSGLSEEIVGALLKEARQRNLQDKCVVATKFLPNKWMSGKMGIREAMMKAAKESRARLGVDCIDLYQIHSAHFPAKFSEQAEALADIVDAKLARAVGVSNFSTEEMLEVYDALQRRGMHLATNQVEYSLLRQLPDSSGLHKACQERGIRILAYSPIAMGRLTGKYGPDKPPLGRRGFGNADWKVVDRVLQGLREAGERHGKTPTEVALNWVMARGAIPIPGAKLADQARMNDGSMDWSLTNDEVEHLASLGEDGKTSHWQHG
uniref:NADP-dependent oxidoreductase domain-containing protein n=1 Tax=Dunaliella tertiolecta TaxID=3047 RepID=A0A7S3VHH7_DUNTE|mmetsp:Transcript_13984/g.37779  ORF Transcript_13984/g.37779 Transcript_13984/m.37779 type:complete len:339 (-) Transcript_13984:418-1434(-)|eukprot:CAMPEP_0202380594 /NCGR_PEP_ID=MMETSP1127-20130417/29684_1 /ASSEMBLY_ACC=CAM_ASM_000462 /TAXON_ID=3047 /ORGANISM="Dunaliella tertiolecta, Strain CCMP1320" /LENGTH=338 /DNA_ID=CAMNT_0048979323 /DNA_START=25 /DNA_END=1041 /DNA_ORIENTATION=-